MGSTTVIDLGRIAKRLGLPEPSILAAVQLIDEGNTVPFITRYRRDQTGGLDELQLRSITDAVGKARQLADRKQTILRTIEGQGKLTFSAKPTNACRLGGSRCGYQSPLWGHEGGGSSSGTVAGVDGSRSVLASVCRRGDGHRSIW